MCDDSKDSKTFYINSSVDLNIKMFDLLVELILRLSERVMPYNNKISHTQCRGPSIILHNIFKIRFRNRFSKHFVVRPKCKMTLCWRKEKWKTLKLLISLTRTFKHEIDAAFYEIFFLLSLGYHSKKYVRKCLNGLNCYLSEHSRFTLHYTL